MKNIFTKSFFAVLTILTLSSINAIAQVPAIMDFQAIAYEPVNHNVIKKSYIDVQVTTIDSANGGKIVYQEEFQNIRTDTNGYFSVQLNGGKGRQIGSGTFNSIPWATGKKYLKIEYRPRIPGTYILVGTIRLATVPYSMVSQTTLGVNIPANKDEVLTYNGTKWVPQTAKNDWADYAIIEDTNTIGKAPVQQGSKTSDYVEHIREFNYKSSVGSNITLPTTTKFNSFTLAPGTYYIEGYTTSFGNGGNTCFIYNTTSSKIEIMGISQFARYSASSAAGSSTASPINGVIKVTGSKTTFQLHQFINDHGTGAYYDVALGINAMGGASIAGAHEVFARLIIRKID